MDILYLTKNVGTEQSLKLTRDRLRPFSEKSRHCLKKVQSQMHFSKKKQTNPPFEDQSHNKIIIKRRDFYSATVFRNLKRAFNGVEAIIS